MSRSNFPSDIHDLRFKPYTGCHYWSQKVLYYFCRHSQYESRLLLAVMSAQQVVIRYHRILVICVLRHNPHGTCAFSESLVY